jgi:hypothetical protein
MVILLMQINTSYMLHNMKTRMLHAMQNLPSSNFSYSLTTFHLAL